MEKILHISKLCMTSNPCKHIVEIESNGKKYREIKGCDWISEKSKEQEFKVDKHFKDCYSTNLYFGRNKSFIDNSDK